MQRDLFPAASALPNPADRARARDNVSAPFALWLYVLFALLPGTVAALSVAAGETYGEAPYRFLVSWLFFWVVELLTLDPFVTRYRRQLVDVVQHWHKLHKCSQTALFVCFDHGFLYYALLWSLAYVFVFIEAALLLFARLEAAADLTSLLFVGLIVVCVVAWIGRIVESHGLVVAARQQPRQPRYTQQHAQQARLDDGVVVSVAVGGEVRVVLADGVQTRPDVQLNADAHLDLVDHLERNRRQLTVDHNTLTIEVAEQLNGVGCCDGYRCYRRSLWAALIMFGGGSLALVLRESYDLWRMSDWSVYATLVGMMIVVLMVAWYGGRRFADPTFLQMFLLLSTTLPIVYGNWLLKTYAAVVRDSANQKLPWTTLILLLHMVLTQFYWTMMQALVTRLSAPAAYTRFMMLPLLLAYVFQYVIFGFTPWSVEFVLVLVLTSLHNVLASTGLYLDAWTAIRRQCVRANERPHRTTPEQEAIRSFQHLLRTRHTMQVFALDTVADIWSFVVVVWLVFVMWALKIPIDSVLPSFTVEPLTLRLSVLLIIRGLAWVSGQLVFRRKLQQMSQSEQQSLRPHEHQPMTLAAQLDLYLESLGLSVFETSLVRACYEEDAPELFAHIAADGDHSAQQQTGSLAELLLLQIAERQWLLHPALLRKYFLYFHACMYYLLFIILQSAPDTRALRYAWFRT
jgi:hypothetical protein